SDVGRRRAGEGEREQVVEHPPPAAGEAEVVRVERGARLLDEAAELGHVACVERLDVTERQREPVGQKAVMLADLRERRGEVAAAAHVVLRGDFEEGHAPERRAGGESLEHIVDEVPAQAQADALEARGACHHALLPSEAFTGHSPAWWWPHWLGRGSQEGG